MKYKMILGQTLFSFMKKNDQGLKIKEVRFMNRDTGGNVSGTTRLLYDEESETVQRYVSGSAPIASLSDDMVCFLGEVSRCFGRLSGEESWEKDVWLCVDADVRPEHARPVMAPAVVEEELECDAEIQAFPLPGLGNANGNYASL